MDHLSTPGSRQRSLTIVLCWLLFLTTLLAGCGAGHGQSKQASPGAAPSNGSPTQGGTGVGATSSLSPTITAAPSSTSSVPTPTPTPLPTVAVLIGQTLPPGSALPSEAQCAASIQRSSFEPRPQNKQANQSVPTVQQIAAQAPWGPNIGQDPKADSLRQQMTGNFTGTTDEILQWTACKWGIDPDVVRAEAVIESYWRQSTRSDYTSTQKYCPPGTWNGTGCYQSYGILQIKYYYFKSTWPMSRDDTAFNAEYAYGILRACYEGWTTYLNSATPLPGYPRYHAGDLWGCLGRWFSGTWYSQAAVDYIARVKAALIGKTWFQPGF